jgi:uncharacterized LabA/DUF88 family protein
MATTNENVSMALFCDFENVALGVRDAKYEKFDIKPVLERLLLKGSIVVKKAYCDWERYKGFKASMHEANFELIEIPHVRQSGKNSADIRLVVDALDLCYTKSHVDTFVIISGDSDFSPLVSKLRENAKRVIGVGVKQSTSDLLVANCDEFIFYDDLVRESQRQAAKRDKREPQPAVKRSSEEERSRKDELEARRGKAIEIAVETFDALVSEQGDGGKIWASVLKDAIKRRKPDFSESYYGFRAFGNLLEEARARGLLDVGRDEKSGTFVFRGHEASLGNDPAPGRTASSPSAAEARGDMHVEARGETAVAVPGGPSDARAEPRRKGRGSRRGGKAGDVARESAVRSGGQGARHPDLFAAGDVSTPHPALPQETAHDPRAYAGEWDTPVSTESSRDVARDEESGAVDEVSGEPRRRSRGTRRPATSRGPRAQETLLDTGAVEPNSAPSREREMPPQAELSAEAAVQAVPAKSAKARPARKSARAGKAEKAGEPAAANDGVSEVVGRTARGMTNTATGTASGTATTGQAAQETDRPPAGAAKKSAPRARRPRKAATRPDDAG